MDKYEFDAAFAEIFSTNEKLTVVVNADETYDAFGDMGSVRSVWLFMMLQTYAYRFLADKAPGTYTFDYTTRWFHIGFEIKPAMN